MRKSLVVYHYPCLDGTAARYAAWSHLGNSATYIQGKYEDAVDISLFADRDVYLVDFCYKASELIQILDVCNKLVILDHHKTALPEINKAERYDMEMHPHTKLTYMFYLDHSGAHIAWRYFHSTDTPIILQHVEDRDLWRFNMPYTKEICCYLESLQHDLGKWAKTIEMDSLRDIISKGCALRQIDIKAIEDIYRTYELIEFEGHTVPMVTNCPRQYISEVCHLLLQRGNYPFSTNRSWTGDSWVWSMRSAEGGLDVAELSRKRGGGGHMHAAGFSSNAKVPYGITIS